MHLRRLFGAWVGAVALALSVWVAGPVEAGPVVKITAVGTISVGTDDAGQLTNIANSSLVGQTITLIQTLEAGPDAILDTSGNPSSSLFDLVTLEFTIGSGPTFLFSAASPQGGASYGLDPSSSLLDSQMTILLGTDTLTSVIDVFDAQISSALPLQSFAFNSFDPGSFVSADRSGEGGNLMWQFQVNGQDLRSVRVDVINDIPEPAVVLLLASALLASVFRRTRARNFAA